MNEEKALKEVARQNGVSVAEVRREIEIALEEARKNSNPKIQAFWRSFPNQGGLPTIEEVILHIAKQASHVGTTRKRTSSFLQ